MAELINKRGNNASLSEEDLKSINQIVKQSEELKEWLNSDENYWLPSTNYSKLQIEPTTFCSTCCIYCSQANEKIRGINFGREKAVMSFETWKRLVDEILSLNTVIHTFSPQILGEFFTNPKAYEMLKYFLEKNQVQKRFCCIDILTNGVNMTQQLSDLMLANSDQIHAIIVSMDAIKPETFLKIKMADKLPELMENVKYLIRKSKGVKYHPDIVLQYIVLEENLDEIPGFMDFWIGFFENEQTDYQISTEPVTYLNMPSFTQHIFTLHFKQLIPFTELAEAEKLHSMGKKKVEECFKRNGKTPAKLN